MWFRNRRKQEKERKNKIVQRECRQVRQVQINDEDKCSMNFVSACFFSSQNDDVDDDEEDEDKIVLVLICFKGEEEIEL